MGGFGAAAGPAAAAGTRHPHGTPSGNAMGRSGREARSGGAAGTSRGFWTCCFSRTQDGAQSWRLLSAGDGINRSLPGVGGGGAGRSHSPSPPAGEVQSASPPPRRHSRDPPPAPDRGRRGCPHPCFPPSLDGTVRTPAPQWRGGYRRHLVHHPSHPPQALWAPTPPASQLLWAARSPRPLVRPGPPPSAAGPSPLLCQPGAASRRQPPSPSCPSPPRGRSGWG